MLDLAGDKVMQFLTDYKNATRQLEALGFKVGTMTVGMGLLPEVHTSLVGDINSIDVPRLTAMMNDKSDDKLLASLLKALIMAKNVHAHVESTLKSVTLQIKLGVPPSVSVELS
ncbi:MAG TPA: hypothetical protein VK505_00445 [Steroidobacteraceae bacterium]|nr:hypothetical protein [Steroidobacteraceae bacterium]